MWIFICIVVLSSAVRANYPSFEASHRMRVLLLPADMRVGSVIYRLRATDPDYDYPLRFDVVDSVGRSIIRIDSLPCTPTHTFCQGNVYLTKRLEPERVYDMILSVRDSTGQETKVDATIKATLATSHFEDVFPYVPSLLMVPEDTPLGSNLGFVLARRSPPIPLTSRPADGRGPRRNTEMEMWGSENFRLYQTTGTRDLVNATIKLTAELDFEERTMYMLTIFALDPWTVDRDDTRNIAGFQLPVVVTDVQDMPPVFTQLPPVTTLQPNLRVGDKVLQVHAQDGDRGDSRQVRYGLVSEKNPFTTFFNISEHTGEIILAKPLKELQTITRSNQPIILTVMAEEVKLDIHEPPALTATATVALLLSPKLTNTSPKFMNHEYVARLKENAPQGTALVFGASYSTVVEDLDSGPDGVFALGLQKDNGTFEVSPTVAESRANFILRVRNNGYLDFEKRTSVSFQVLASELAPGSLGQNASALVTVYLDDENDNSPVFAQARYQAQLPENMTAETLVTQVSATDLDSGLFGRVAYTRILGYLNHSLTIDSNTGVIMVATNNHGFDREAAAEYKFTVEARDMDGTGNKATVPLTLRLLDVNDETPEFEHQVFEFILQPGLRNFTSRAFVKAIDRDAEPPNNIVRYEIMSGNIDNKFHLNEVTGELTIRGMLSRKRGSRGLLTKKEQISAIGVKKGQLVTEVTQSSSLTAVAELSKSKTENSAVAELRGAKVEEEWADELRRGSNGRQEDYSFEDDEFAGRSGGDGFDSVIVLNIRAYDLGIPHRWQRAHVRIYPPESRARNMNFIVAGSNPDVRTTEELLRTLTGGRVTIQEIKPYTGAEQGTDLSGGTRQQKSVVTATVIYEGNSVVDLQQLEKRLTANKTQAIVEQSVLEYKSENRILFWLLMFFLILVSIAAVLLLLCCLWQGCIVCPCLEVHSKKAVVSPRENLRFIAKEKEVGTETKGVQAAYSARREAWSARHDDVRYGPNGYHPYYGHSNGIRVDHSRHPTMLVEDVEGQEGWEHDPRNKRNQRVYIYDDRHGKEDRRSPGTPRFPKGGSPYHRRSPIGDRGGGYYISPARDKGEYDRSPARNKGDYHRSPGRNGGDYHRSPGRDGGDYHRSPGRDGGDYHRSPGRDGGDYHRSPGRGKGDYNRSPGRGRPHDRSPTRGIDEAFISHERGAMNEMNAYQRRGDDLRDGVEDLVQSRGNSPINPQDFQDEILYRQEDDLKDSLEKGVGTEGGGRGGIQKEDVNLTLPHDMLNPDSDSLRRHEMERGSLARDWEGGEDELIDREQLYFRDGNAEILRLLTRGPRDERPHTLVQESGKEILMQRFMEDQGDRAAAGLLRDYLTQDYLGRLLYPHVQNLQDTQSLPGHMESGTQTECEASTQTDEPALLLPPQRNARSDNELSDDEDRPGRWRKGRRANIKTPIMEEGESLISAESAQALKDTRPAMFPLPGSANQSASETTVPTYTENKSSILRRRKVKEKDEESSGDEGAASDATVVRHSRNRKKNPNTVQIRADSLNRLYRALKELQRTGSQTELTHSEDEPEKDYLKKAGFFRRIKDSTTTTTGSPADNSKEEEVPKPTGASRSKYMDWYKNLGSSAPKPKKQNGVAKRKEDDIDSGIALSSLLGPKKSKMEKKSVFTIAYDDVQTKNIRPDTNSSQKL